MKATGEPFDLDSAIDGLEAIAENPENIENFNLIYTAILLECRVRLNRCKTLEVAQELKRQAQRLKYLKSRQLNYLIGMKEKAMIDEFETLPGGAHV